MYSKYETKTVIINTLMSPVYKLSRQQANKLFVDSLNYFYSDNKIKSDAWRQIYANKLEDLSAYALACDDIAQSRRCLNDAAKMRGVFDEKVQNARTFDQQRRRWLAAQWHYFRHHLLDAFSHLLSRGNVDYMDKVVQFIMPPRLLLLGCSLLLTPLSLLAADAHLFQVWLAVPVISALALLLATPDRFFNRRTLTAMASLPHGFWLMFTALFKLRNVNKKFIHTEHSVTGKIPAQGR